MTIENIEDLDRYIFVEKGVLAPTEYDILVPLIRGWSCTCLIGENKL